MKKKAVSLLSGGLDSCVSTVLAASRYDVAFALTFDYGQRAFAKESEAADRLCSSYGIERRVIALPWLEEMTETALVNRRENVPRPEPGSLDEKEAAEKRARQVWVPNRNGLIANIAACYADAFSFDAIIAGFNAEEAEAFPDNSFSFTKILTECFSLSTQSHPEVVSPTADMRKKEIVRLAIDMGIDYFWSCYHDGEKMCGTCESCLRTIRAFSANDSIRLIAHRFERAPI